MTSSPAAPLLMIPGPTELDDSVLESLSHRPLGHADPKLIEYFGASLELLRTVFKSKDGQPFILTASGTLGWDITASNFVEPGQDVLVVSTGYFGDKFAQCLECYGAKVTVLSTPPGTIHSDEQITTALKEKDFKLVTLTHVDTSTGVLLNIKATTQLIHSILPSALVAVDGVCSIGGEELDMDAWGVDLAFTASQKAIGCPAGLCLYVASARSIAVLNDRVARKVPIGSWYANLSNWLPIMKAYEARQPSYFATPAVQLIVALHQALSNLVNHPNGIDGVIAHQRASSDAFKAGVAALGLTFVPTSLDISSHLLSAIRFPTGVTATDLIPRIRAGGAVITGGLHPLIRTEYFRVGHMGVSALKESRGDLLVVLRALENALVELNVPVTKGAAEKAFLGK